MPTLVYSADASLPNEATSVEERIAALAERLSQRAKVNAAHDDQYCWEQATDYVSERSLILAEHRSLSPKDLNKQIRRQSGYVGPGSTFMSHAWRLHETWPEVYSTSTILEYWHYRQIANSRVADKEAVRAWAEQYRPTQQELRDRIRELVGDDVIRRGFRLQTTNHWRFPSNDGFDRSAFDGGIDRDVIANLLHYFTDPGDLVVDPMAGSGRLARVAELPYFRADWVDDDPADNGGARRILMSDLSPVDSNIVQADARHAIPFSGAKLIILDPPYWRIARDKYEHGGDRFEEWLCFLEAALINCRDALDKTGCLALVLDDYLRSGEERPLALLGATIARAAGFLPRLTIYNNYTNATATLDALGQWRAKKARLMVNGMKIINIFQKGS